jgi:hypothetical protein
MCLMASALNGRDSLEPDTTDDEGARQLNLGRAH